MLALRWLKFVTSLLGASKFATLSLDRQFGELLIFQSHHIY